MPQGFEWKGTTKLQVRAGQLHLNCYFTVSVNLMHPCKTSRQSTKDDLSE